MKLLGLAAALLVAAATAGVSHADTVLPTWEITASGTFSGIINGNPSPSTESFTANLTLTFDDEGGILLPVYTGSANFTGILGDFTASWSDFIPSGADGGYLPLGDSYGDEVDFNVSYYDYLFSGNPLITPHVGVPYLYSCEVPSICAAYGSGTGNGVFAGVGTVNQQATLVTPEPPTLLLLSLSLPFIPFTRGKRWLRVQPIQRTDFKRGHCRS